MYASSLDLNMVCYIIEISPVEKQCERARRYSKSKYWNSLNSSIDYARMWET